MPGIASGAQDEGALFLPGLERPPERAHDAGAAALHDRGLLRLPPLRLHRTGLHHPQPAFHRQVRRSRLKHFV